MMLTDGGVNRVAFASAEVLGFVIDQLVDSESPCVSWIRQLFEEGVCPRTNHLTEQASTHLQEYRKTIFLDWTKRRPGESLFCVLSDCVVVDRPQNWTQLQPSLYDAAGGQCLKCGQFLPRNPIPFTIDEFDALRMSVITAFAFERFSVTFDTTTGKETPLIALAFKTA